MQEMFSQRKALFLWNRAVNAREGRLGGACEGAGVCWDNKWINPTEFSNRLKVNGEDPRRTVRLTHRCPGMPSRRVMRAGCTRRGRGAKLHRSSVKASSEAWKA